MGELIYPSLVYAHLLLFVLWLGADVGVFLLGQHFRRRHEYTLDQRLALLKLLVLVDMTPRTSWALMVPLSLTVSYVGGWWELPLAIVGFGWLIGGFWLWLVWDAHWHDQTPRAARNRRIEGWIRWILAAGYIVLGAGSLLTGHPIAAGWLAMSEGADARSRLVHITEAGRETRRQAVDDDKSQAAGRCAAAGNAAAVFRVRSGCGTQGMGYKQL